MNKINLNKIKLKLALLASMAGLFVPAHTYAVDLVASSEIPSIGFLDIDIGAGTSFDTWSLNGDSQFFLLQDVNANLTGENTHTVMSIFGANGADLNENSFIVDSAGDVNLANGSIFVDRSESNVGIGTATPVTDLHLVGDLNSGTGLRMELPTAIPEVWNLGVGPNNFSISHGGGFPTTVVSLELDAPANSFRATATGVGIGTPSPESSLHVKKAGALLTVEDSTAGGVKNVIKLKRPGSVGFSMENTALGEAWDFRTAGNGGFLVSKIGDSANKFQINLDGRVFMADAKFDLKPDGTLTIAGNSNALLHVNTSSREAKTDFAKINTKEVMAKIKAMEVSEWRYKDSAAQGRHIGPVAEDFYSLFKLGADDKHIAASDIASIALIAAKELQKKSDSINIETATLKAETSALKVENAALKKQGIQLGAKNDELQNRLASLEKLVTNLALGKGLLPEKGDKVVIK